MQKRRKCCKYQYFLEEMDKTLQIPAFLKAKQKTQHKSQHFWRVDRQKWWYLHGFCTFEKTWKARNTVNSGVLAAFGRRNAGIYAVFAHDGDKPL